jgi:hypothetical protein
VCDEYLNSRLWEIGASSAYAHTSQTSIPLQVTMSLERKRMSVVIHYIARLSIFYMQHWKLKLYNIDGSDLE